MTDRFPGHFSLGNFYFLKIQLFNNGLILQWERNSTHDAIFTFPVAFTEEIVYFSGVYWIDGFAQIAVNLSLTQANYTCGSRHAYIGHGLIVIGW